LRPLLIALLLLVSTYSYSQSILDTPLDGSERGKTLAQVLADLEAKNPVKIFVVSDWLNGVVFKDSSQSITYREAFYNLLLQTDLSFFEPNPNTIVFVKDPTSALRHVDFLTNARTKQEKIQQIIIGDPSRSTARRVVLTGKITDAKSKEPLIGATVQASDVQVGTVTNAEGVFSLTLTAGSHLIKCSYVNFEEMYFDIAIYADGSVNWSLEESPTYLNEVIIQDRAAREITTSRIGITQLNMTEMKRAPALLGEVDLIKSIQVLPGVTTAGEAASGFNVRGGGVDQNLILYDGMPVFNSSHVFGFFSAFNSEAIRDVTFFRGGIPAEFGGRISSVLDIRSKEGSYNTWNASGGIGIISSNLLVNGPLVKDKTSIAVSMRSTYSDWLINTVQSNYVDLSNSSVTFYDGSLKLSHKFNDKSKITLSGYTSHDRFKLSGDSTFQWDTRMAALRWDHEFSSKVSLVVAGGVGHYSYDVSDQNLDRGFNLVYGILYPSFKTEAFYKIANHKFSTGIQSTYYAFSPGTLNPSSEASNVKSIQMPDQYSLESGVYASDQFQLFKNFHVDVGFRYSFFQSFGPADVTLYREGVPRETLSVIDTLSFAQGEVIKSYQNPEPRLSLRYEIGANSSIKFGYNRMVQYMHLVTNTTAVTPVDVWQPSGYYFKPQTADQLSLGYFRNFKDKAYETFVEVYYKEIENVLDFKDGAQLILNQNIETDLLQGNARAYGVEFQVAKTRGRLEGSFGYAFSRSLRTVVGDFEEESINNGIEYSSNFDQPHVVNLNWRYNITKRYFFTGGFTYRTGRPITIPVTAFSIENYTVSSFSDRNQYRVPDYHRLDLGLVIEGNHKRKKFWDGTWTFSIYNVYGRKNPYSVFFKEARPGILRPYQLSIIGTAVPSISYSFKL
jgi:hypothetical protein